MYNDEQHIAVEQQLHRTTRQLEEFLKFLPLPSCVFRRTGQILAVSRDSRQARQHLAFRGLSHCFFSVRQGNRKFCEITGLTASQMSSRQLAIYGVSKVPVTQVQLTNNP